MFGIFRKRELEAHEVQRQIDSALEQMGASVLLVTQSGKVVMTADSLRHRPRNWLGGQVMEVTIRSPGLDPYFVYYENDHYYFSMVVPQQSLSAFQEHEEYRSKISQTLCFYLILQMKKSQGKDIRHPSMEFSHNRIHTNVIAYVERLGNCYPIQHNSDEPDSATERKVAQLNRGEIDITDVIAVHEPSPA